MKFELYKSIKILENTPGVLKNLLIGLDNEWIYSNEGEGTWNPFDVVGHLIRGEETVWIPRTKFILEYGESKPFEPFDRFAQFERFKGIQLNELLDLFEDRRKNNLRTLEKLNINDEKLALTGTHPEFGKVSISEILAAWIVHDLGHISQIVRVMSKQLTLEAGPFKKYLKILNR